MSAELEEKESERRRLHKSMSRLRNRKNERKRRKKDRLIAEYCYRHWMPSMWIVYRNGRERVHRRSKSWKKEMKKVTARAARRTEELPDGNAYKKTEDRWNWT